VSAKAIAAKTEPSWVTSLPSVPMDFSQEKHRGLSRYDEKTGI